ncbi:hypothetical protein UNSW2_1427 [Campylobacter concisus UNSW2]|uniref:Uncharacterized protein n=1 Tax=Campylobacter concisus UNSW2 TaxID=1242965 RepID=U2FLC0_9BACT|nr:hypothetical protein UNSW2_1427 [Campylobacter concisus UNSW2]
MLQKFSKFNTFCKTKPLRRNGKFSLNDWLVGICAGQTFSAKIRKIG